MAVIGSRVFTDDELELLHLVAIEYMKHNENWGLLAPPPEDREGSAEMIRHEQSKLNAARKLYAATVTIVDAK
jgi:sugar phosphate isomerase/epimerase